MKRAWRIYITFTRSCIARDLEFRANFIAKAAQSLIWMGFFLVVMLVIYGNTSNLAGWKRGDAFILLATVYLIEAINSIALGSLVEIPEMVRTGTLDFVITKPVDTQFWISCRKFNFAGIGSLLGGILLLVAGLSMSHIAPSLLQWAAYILGTIGATVLLYAVNLFFMSTGIWFVKVDNLWVLSTTVLDVARFPMDIVGSALRRVFTYFIPLAFVATVPSSQLVKGLDLPMLGVGFAYTGVAFMASRTFWRFAISHYTSASS